VAPDAAFRAEQFLERQERGRSDDIYFANNIALKRDRQDWYVERFDTRDYTMENVKLTQQHPDGTDARCIQAKKASWMDGRWWFLDITIQQYDENGDLFGAPEILLMNEMSELTETPKTFMSEIKDTQYLSSSEMRSYLHSKKEISDNDRARLEVDLHSRVATPLVCLIVTLIGIPVGAHTGRKGALAGIMLALSLFFIFYAFQLFSQYMGKEEWISAWLGGWLPVILFGAATPFMIHRMR